MKQHLYFFSFMSIYIHATHFLPSQSTPFTPHNLLYMTLHGEESPALISLSAVQNDMEPHNVTLRDGWVNLWFQDDSHPSRIPFEQFQSWYAEASEVEYALTEVVYHTGSFFTYLAQLPTPSSEKLLSTLTEVLREYKQNPPGYLCTDQNRVFGQVGYKLHPGVYSTCHATHLSHLSLYADAFDQLKNLIATSSESESSPEKRKNIFDDWYWQETAQNAEQHIINFIQNQQLEDILRERCRQLWTQLHLVRQGCLLDQRGFSVRNGRYFVGKGISRYGDYLGAQWHTERVPDPFGYLVRCFWTSSQRYADYLARWGL